MKLSKWLLICLIVLIVNIKAEGKRRKRRFSLLNSKEEEKTKIDSVDKEIIGAIKQTYVSTKKIDEVINQINHCKDKICNNNTNTTNPTSKPTKHNSKIKQKKIQKILTCCIVQSLKFTNFATPEKRGFPQYEKRRNKNKRKRKVINPN